MLKENTTAQGTTKVNIVLRIKQDKKIKASLIRALRTDFNRM
ncbi:MAG: hypothetical protein P1P64_08070 [Treponemataceae bacterium]